MILIFVIYTYDRCKNPFDTTNVFLRRHAVPMLNIRFEHEYDARAGSTCACGGLDNDGAPRKALYRCGDCFQHPPCCGVCLLNSHIYLPFHRITQWCDPGYFAATSLAKVGMVIRLNHLETICPYYETQRDLDQKAITVIHDNGLHEVKVQYCRCGDATSFSNMGENSPPCALWQAGMWPATYHSPATVATVSVLRSFQLLSVECKLNSSSFFTYLRRRGAVLREEEFPVRPPVNLSA